LRDLGVEIVHGDLRSRADLDTACRGATTVISTATAMGTRDSALSLRDVDGIGTLALIDAARAAGAQQFVFISVSPNLPDTSPLVRYKRAAERAIRASGMRWTILQPSVFMDVWLSDKIGWDHAAGRATIFGGGTAPISWVSIVDVAEVAVRSVDDSRLEQRDVPVGGPEALSPDQVLAIFERVSGKRYSARRVPRIMLATMGPVVSLFNEMIASGMLLGAAASDGDVIDRTLQDQLGLQLTTVEEYARRVTARPSS
jgi:uncharacterized protein YbjT (DUF2867 family)